MIVPFIEPLARSEEDKSIVQFGFSHFGSTAGAARSVSDHLKIEIGSVGSERSRSLAGRLARFVTDKTLLLSESGIGSLHPIPLPSYWSWSTSEYSSPRTGP